MQKIVKNEENKSLSISDSLFFSFDKSYDDPVINTDKITDKYAAQKSNIKFYFKKKISLYKQILSIVR